MRVRKAIHGVVSKSRYGQGWTGTAQLRAIHEILFYVTLSLCLGSTNKPAHDVSSGLELGS
jgi:hypothetical protein